MRPGAEFLEHLVDDAAIFPPGNVPLEQAVTAHRKHLAAPYAALVGGFVVSDTRLADLAGIVASGGRSRRQAPRAPCSIQGAARPEDGGRAASASERVETRVEPRVDTLGVNVVVTGGAGAIEPAVRWATRAEGLELRALEIALRDEEDLSRNAARVVAMVEHVRDSLPDSMARDDVAVYVEPPRMPDGPSHGWLAALDEIAMADLRLKFRTGGVSADAFPSGAELARSIDAALDREIPFKCTAGLHHAVHHTDPATGFGHHGFLNVLLATRVALDGGDVAAALADHRPTDRIDPDTAASARRWFTSFGSCSVLEAHQDLVDLGLWTDHPREGTA